MDHPEPRQTLPRNFADQYRNEGFVMLPSVLGESTVRMLQKECDEYVAVKADDPYQLNNEDRAFTESGLFEKRETLRRFLFSDLTEQICAQTLGSDAYLFNEFFVVKYGGGKSGFGWHQDSGYVGYEHRPYVTLWIALDDMTEENGTVYVLPYSRAGTKEVIEHKLDGSSNDRVGYHGDDLGDPAIIPAGSIVVFSSTTLHRSEANRSDKPRRAYIVQFTPEPLMNKEGSAPLTLATPFLQRGMRVS